MLQNHDLQEKKKILIFKDKKIAKVLITLEKTSQWKPKTPSNFPRTHSKQNQLKFIQKFIILEIKFYKLF